MSLSNDLRTWWQLQTGDDDTPFGGDSTAFFASLIFHLCLLLVLGLVPLALRDDQVSLTVAVPLEEPLEELKVQQEFAFSAAAREEIGANSVRGDAMALSLAPEISDISLVSSPTDLQPTDAGTIELNRDFDAATGLNFSQHLAVRGAAGEGVTGAMGAIDRLTQEILRSLEERKTLVVWLFDQSGSLARQRQAIHDRFDRIYEELGVIEVSGNPAFARHEDKPLLTSVIAFGEQVTLRTPQPTDDLAEIKRAVAGIELDDSGIERVFSAIHMAVERYKPFRIRDPVHNQPDRNVLLIAFTDERGDDHDGLETTISACRRLGVPVYVVGVPAPFGLAETLVKWVDPDPQYDQSPQWPRVDQGPESLVPERLLLPFGDEREDPDPMDSGFGPFALTRLCYETGGIYFSVHPNRAVDREVGRDEVAEFSAHLKHFFDPQVMRRYRPDYVPVDEYQRRLQSNGSRAALITAARHSWANPPETPRLKFVRRSEPQLAEEFARAEAAVAKNESRLREIWQALQQGEADRPRETTPRWQAGYDLAMGRTLAELTRTGACRAMLVQARTGMNFAGQNNTWTLEPASGLPPGSPLEETDLEARRWLGRVIQEHPGTPWALLAQRTIDASHGWSWAESFTDLAPAVRRGGGDGDGGGGDGRGVGREAAPPAPVRREPPKL